MKKLCIVFMVVFCLVVTVQAQASMLLYGVNSADDGLSLIDPLTGVVTFIGPLDPDPNRFTTPVTMAVRPSGDKIFVWNNSDYTGANIVSTGVLLTVNPTTGLATEVDPSYSNEGQLSALAFAPDETLFGVDTSLFEIDSTTGEKGLIGTLGNGRRVAGADFSADGTLYGVTLYQNELVTINTITGLATLIASLDVNIGIPGSIVFDPETETLVGSGFNGPNGNILFDINITDGTVSNIRSLIGFAPQGMGFAVPISVTKELVEYWDEDADGLIEVGEETDFQLKITVTNNDAVNSITGVVVKDRLGGDLELSDYEASIGSVDTYTKGKTAKVFLTWAVGNLAAGASATLDLVVSTDINPGDQQEYTEAGIHYLNSGANAKGIFLDSQVSATSDPITVRVVQCYPDLPSPDLIYTGSEDYAIDLTEYTRYKLEVTNSVDFPDELFVPSPHLPPCGLNTNASRTWVKIYDNNDDYLYGFCALSCSDDLNLIWFAKPKGTPPPTSVYITLHDRECDITYTSNLVVIIVEP